MVELWKPVIGYEGIYEVSNMGRIRSLDRTIVFYNKKYGIIKRELSGKMLTPKFDGAKNYLHVNLSKDGTSKSCSVHRIVASAFIPNPQNYSQVNHKDENKENNFANNLEWCTSKYNCNYGSKADASKGENNAMNRISEETVRAIKMSYIAGDKKFGVSGLAKKFNLSQTHVCAIIKGRRWGWLK